MTYRDDHDAALQRAAALEVELERAKVERDDATKERDRLAGELAAKHDPPPEQRIVVVSKSPLTPAERDELAGRLARGVNGYRIRSWIGVCFGAVFAIGAVVCTARAAFGFALLCVFVATVYGGMSISQLLKSMRECWEPVLAAVRNDPTKIVAVRRISGKSGWWLTIETRTGELHMRGDAAAMRLLERHCPGAQFDG